MLNLDKTNDIIQQPTISLEIFTTLQNKLLLIKESDQKVHIGLNRLKIKTENYQAFRILGSLFIPTTYDSMARYVEKNNPLHLITFQQQVYTLRDIYNNKHIDKSKIKKNNFEVYLIKNESLESTLCQAYRIQERIDRQNYYK